MAALLSSALLLLALLLFEAKPLVCIHNSSTKKSQSSEPWPPILVAQTLNSGTSKPEALYGWQETKDVAIQSYDVETGNISMLPTQETLSTPSITGSIHGRICFSLAKAPWFACIENNLVENPLAFPEQEEPLRIVTEYTPSDRVYIKVELSPDGQLIMYTNPKGLFMTFLNRGDTSAIIDTSVPFLPAQRAIVDFAVHWSTGILAMLYKQSLVIFNSTEPIVDLYAYSDKNENFLNSSTKNLVFRYNFEEDVLSRLTFDVDRETLYAVSEGGFIRYVKYENLSNLEFEYLRHPNKSQVRIPVVLKRWSPAPVFAHKDFIYYLRSYDNQLARLNVVTLDTEVPARNLPKHHLLRYTQLVMETSSLKDYVSSETCSKCSHRCFPKYPKEAACSCPLGSIDAHAQRCLSPNTLIAVWSPTDTESAIKIINMVTGAQRPVDIPSILNDSSIVPEYFVKLWNPSSKRHRFCVVSRTSEDMYIISCHHFAEATNFFILPFTWPIDDVKKITSVTEEGDGKRWIVTWLNEAVESLHFKTSDNPTQILTLYTDLDPIGFTFDGSSAEQLDLSTDVNGLEFSVDGSEFSYAFLRISNFLTIWLIYVGRSSSWYQEDFTGKSIRLHRNSVYFFDDPLNSTGQKLGHILINSQKMVRLNIGLQQSDTVVVEKYPFNPGSLFGDICWKQHYSVRCLLNGFQQDSVLYESSTPIQSITEQAWHLSEETHVCFTGRHHCSHVCQPHVKNSSEYVVESWFEPGYTCLCPVEFPILLKGRNCSLRLTVSIYELAPGPAGFENQTSVWRLTEQTSEMLLKIRGSQDLQYHLDPVTNQICWLEARLGIACGNNSWIPGSSEAKFLVDDDGRCFANEIYWITEKVLENGRIQYCLLLGAANRNVSIRLGCLKLEHQLLKHHVTVDAQRKLLFWTHLNPATGAITLHTSRITSEGGEMNTDYSYELEDTGDQNSTQKISIVCDSWASAIFLKKDFPTDVYTYKLSYRATSDSLEVFKEDEVSYEEDHEGESEFTYKLKTKDIRIKFLNVSTLFTSHGQNANVVDVRSAYTADDFQVKNPCLDEPCEHFCQVVENQYGNSRECLCPSDPTAKLSDFEYCKVPIASQEQSPLTLIVSFSAGLLILSFATVTLVVCLYKKRREQVQLQNMINSFLEGDPQRVEASRDEAEKVQFLPFTAIIAPDDLIVNQVKILGEGNFGTVYEGMYNRKVVAVKTTKSNLDVQVVQDFLRELKITAYVGDHPNIVKFHGAEVSQLGSKGRVMVVLELCLFGNLLDYLREISRDSANLSKFLSLPMENSYHEAYIECIPDETIKQEEPADSAPNLAEDFELQTMLECFQHTNLSDGIEIEPGSGYAHFQFKALEKESLAPLEEEKKTLPAITFHWARQIAAGMEYLESKRVVHGDLAARNILVFDNNTVKISDFGYSRNVYQYETYVKKQRCPLPYRWTSPETLTRLEFSSKADVWSFGVTMWEIFTFGDVPFAHMGLDDAFVAALGNGEVRLRCPPLMPEETFEQLLSPCWRLDPAQRPSFKALKDTLAKISNSEA